MRVYRSALVAAGAVLWASPAIGQTLLAWPDTTVDVSTYTTIEQCQAAATRVREGVVGRAALASGNWGDTMPVDPRERSEPLPTVVTETVRRCMARFADPDSIPLTHYATAALLYLNAGWDEKAKALVSRRLAAIGPQAEAELAAAIDTVVSIYRGRWGQSDLRPQPPRDDLAQELALEHLSRVSDRVRRLRIYQKLLVTPDSLDNPVLDERVAARAKAAFDSLTQAERDKLAEEYGLSPEDAGSLEQRLYATLERALGKRTFLDSLRRSTAAFVKLKRHNWARATGRPPETYLLGVPLGERAPAIEADIWLGRRDSTTLRPTPGRVSLVVFISNADCLGVIDGPPYGNCGGALVPLRRLQDRFPEVEITVVAQTHGYFMYLKDSLPPAREAELTKRWLESFGIRAPLAMTTTGFWRLPEPDGRRIERDVSNRTNYSFGTGWQVNPVGGTFLIDRDGIIVHYRSMNRHSEEEFAELIQVLLEREMARS